MKKQVTLIASILFVSTIFADSQKDSLILLLGGFGGSVFQKDPLNSSLGGFEFSFIYHPDVNSFPLFISTNLGLTIQEEEGTGISLGQSVVVNYLLWYLTSYKYLDPKETKLPYILDPIIWLLTPNPKYDITFYKGKTDVSLEFFLNWLFIFPHIGVRDLFSKKEWYWGLTVKLPIVISYRGKASSIFELKEMR